MKEEIYMKIFFNCEFTGLHKNTTLISMGLTADDGKEFYCEFTDYAEDQVDEWIRENVIKNLMFADQEEFSRRLGSVTFVKGDKEKIAKELFKWLQQYKTVELWSDCHHYDVVLFHDIFGGAFSIPDNIYYIPYDISTVFKIYGIDPDISREAFIDRPIAGKKHNALYDARVIKSCYDKLRRNKKEYLESI